jgi:hypothetical protein
LRDGIITLDLFLFGFWHWHKSSSSDFNSARILDLFSLSQDEKKSLAVYLDVNWSYSTSFNITRSHIGRATVERHSVFNPCYLGIELAIAYLLATKITSISISFWQHKLWQIAMLTLISCGVISCAVSSQSETGWNKGDNSIPPIAHVINQSSHPLVVGDARVQNLLSASSDARVQHLLSLSFLLNSKVRLQLTVEPNTPTISQGFSDVFFLILFKYYDIDLRKSRIRL